MKVSTRIIAGYGVLILLTVAVLSYQVIQIRRLHAINTELSEVNVGGVGRALTSVNLKSNQDSIEENLQKYYGTNRDPQYLQLFHDAGNDLEKNLKQLRTGARSDQEREAIEKFSRSWEAVLSFMTDDTIPPAQNREVPPQLQEQLNAMRENSVLVSKATEAAIKDSANRSAETAASGARVSWIAAVSALLLSILVSAPIVWSIATRLRELGGATRIVAAGKFDHRLPASGSDEFADLARDFNTMARKIGELDQMKKDFVSHVSHDLKGPLASTRETVHLLMEEIPGPLNDKQRRLLSLCLKSSQRLSAMITNLLDVSRMEAGMMDYSMEPCDLVPLARSAAAELEGLAREKKVELAVESAISEIWAECDHGRLSQVISNLVENAIKFSPESGRTSLRIEANGAHALLSVSDRGPGIPWVSREKIFDRFHQVNPGKKIAGQGVGLGLAICRTIVEAHGGAIWVEDNPGGGSIFYVRVKATERSRL